MTSRKPLVLLFASLAGCASTHSSDPTPAPEALTALESCLAEGGQLREVASVDNDDVAEHGDVLTLALDDDGRIAVAAADGTIKLWTMDGFLATIDPSVFTYGAELEGRPANDVLFDATGRVVAGDGRGVVTAWQEDGTFTILGGTDPDQQIVAIAIDPSGAWLAHADAREGGHVTLRALEGGEVIGPMTTELTSVRDLAFLSDGALLVAGGAAQGGLEAREASAFTRVRARWTADSGAPIVELAVAADRVAAISADELALLDGELGALWTADVSEHAPVGVALTTNARFVITAGAEGALRVFDRDGAQLGSVDVADPVAVRVDPRGGAIVTGSRDGVVRAFECAAP